jgi:hypothetical protein
MMSLAYSLKLSNQQLTLLVKSLESKFEQAILEAIVEIDFLSLRRPPDNFHFDDAFDLSKWERGRSFGTEMELRWRRRGDDFLSLIICESPLLLAPEVGAIIGTLGNARFLDRVETVQVRLWGEWQDPEAETDLLGTNRHWWYEERVPKFLAYPLNEREKNPAVRVARYRVRDESRQKDTARNFVYRFVRLEAMDIAGEA